MKIGFDTMPETFPQTYSRHLARVLAEHAPEHEYVVAGEHLGDVDIYHISTASIPSKAHLKGAHSVVTVSDLNFLRHPQMYTLRDRLVRIRLYKNACRKADCLIALSRRAKEELAERLAIDERRIKVVLQLAVHPPFEPLSDFERVRRKYSLPQDYVLMLGVAEPRHNQLEAVEALLEIDSDTGLVICGRRTTYSDSVLKYARSVGDAQNIEFLYEPEPADLPAIFRMARIFVYIPDAEAEASVLPVVEALRAGVPMILSDIPAHREIAADAAVYVPQADMGRLSAALECVLGDGEFRRELISRERVRAEVFSEYAVAQRLIDIYTSL